MSDISTAGRAIGIASALRRVNRAVALICGLVLLVAVALILLEVVGRQFPSIRLGGADEISGYVMAGIATWGFAYALTERAHVRIDIVQTKLPLPGRAVFDILAIACVLVVAGLVAWYAYDVFGKSLARGSRSNTPLGVPLWIPQIVWFLGWAWMTISSAILLACLTVLAATGAWNDIETLAGSVDEAGEAA